MWPRLGIREYVWRKEPEEKKYEQLELNLPQALRGAFIKPPPEGAVADFHRFKRFPTGRTAIAAGMSLAPSRTYRASIARQTRGAPHDLGSDDSDSGSWILLGQDAASAQGPVAGRDRAPPRRRRILSAKRQRDRARRGAEKLPLKICSIADASAPHAAGLPADSPIPGAASHAERRRSPCRTGVALLQPPPTPGERRPRA